MLPFHIKDFSGGFQYSVKMTHWTEKQTKTREDTYLSASPDLSTQEAVARIN